MDDLDEGLFRAMGAPETETLAPWPHDLRARAEIGPFGFKGVEAPAFAVEAAWSLRADGRPLLKFLDLRGEGGAVAAVSSATGLAPEFARQRLVGAAALVADLRMGPEVADAPADAPAPAAPGM